MQKSFGNIKEICIFATRKENPPCMMNTWVSCRKQLKYFIRVKHFEVLAPVQWELLN